MYVGLYKRLYEGLYKVCLASEDEYMKKATIAVTESELSPSTLYALRVPYVPGWKKTYKYMVCVAAG